MHDLCVSIAPNPATSREKVTRLLRWAKQLGYQTIAFNIDVEAGVNIDKASSESLSAGEVWQSCASSLKMKCLRRVTLKLQHVSDTSIVSKLVGLFDLVAVMPSTEETFLSACDLNVDILSLPASRECMYFTRKRRSLQQAGKRGIAVELCYNCDQARYFLTIASQVCETLDGKYLIVSSNAREWMGLRGSYDVMNLIIAEWGFNYEKARACFDANAKYCLLQAHNRRHAIRGAVEVISQG